MNEQRQISKLVAALTEHQHNFGVLSSEDRQWVIQNTQNAITLFTDVVKNRSVKMVKSRLPDDSGRFGTRVPDALDSIESPFLGF